MDVVVGSSGPSILSEKVLRALEVRTETPAMKAALEALSHLPKESMDSRSVRVAIEQDALQQALMLQEELRGLVDVVSSLRKDVTESAAIARRVSDAIHTHVVMATTNNQQLNDNTNDNNNNNNNNNNNTLESDEKNNDMMMMEQQHATTTTPTSPEDALECERNLALLLANAFRERDDAAMRAETVASFLEKFDLSEQDSVLLDTYNFEDMDDETNEGMAFLDALERVKVIRSELTSAFGAKNSLTELFQDKKQMGATSAIRMMESLATKQERAFERLYHWLQKYLHLTTITHVPTSSSQNPATDDAIHPDVLDEALSHPFVRRSLQVLYHVPAFYSHTLELIATSRRSEETRRFLLALTSGFNGRAPIEMKAHDPINYVGDMLAFCFQSCSVEADVAKGLVVVPGKQNNDNEEEDDGFLTATLLDDPSSTTHMTASEMLSQAMSGLARPLKARVLQVVASLARRPDEEGDDEGDPSPLEDEEGTIARSRVSSLYSICGLLLFYRSALKKSMNKLSGNNTMSNPLLDAVVDCLNEASQSYVASLKVYAAMLESLSLLCGESEAVLVQSIMARISSVRVASPGFAVDVYCPPQHEAPLSMESLAETLLGAVHCKTLDDAVTLKLSLTHAKKAGLSTTVASQLDARISQDEQSLIDNLVRVETKQVLELCGLGQVVSTWQNMPKNNPDIVMATQPGLTQDDMDSAMKEFYTSLYAPPTPSYESIKDPVLRKLARSKIAQNVVQTYTQLYHDITSERGGYDDLEFLGHTPDQVQTLFGA